MTTPTNTAAPANTIDRDALLARLDGVVDPSTVVVTIRSGSIEGGEAEATGQGTREWFASLRRAITSPDFAVVQIASDRFVAFSDRRDPVSRLGAKMAITVTFNG